jgi:N-acetylneuraminate synthase
LIIFEMANNHMGDPAHGLALVDAFAAVADGFRDAFEFAFKLQYRDLDSFIHPEWRARFDVKHIKRFMETRLDEGAFQAFLARMDQHRFLKVCTPFDEASVDRVERHGFDYLKIASCSLGDWPLMERIAQSPLPVIVSTAGAEIETLDRVVAFFDHRSRPMTLMHCVAEYPTPAGHQRLERITRLKARYPSLRVGLSSHEAAGNLDTVRMALAKGAEVLERHVGLPTAAYPLNGYSLAPDPCRAWLGAAREALLACAEEAGPAASEAEQAALRELRRGVFARQALPAGRRLEVPDLLLAMPAQPGQLTANDLGKYVDFQLTEPVAALAPVLWRQVTMHDNHERVRVIVDRVKRMLEESHTTIGPKCDVEISHHYGLDRFEEFGATIINVVNRTYCKKLLVMLPGQLHPEQLHKKKEETFHLLHGSLQVRLDGQERVLQSGEVLTVERGVRHEFRTADGCILEEISSKHHKDDSYYTDDAINRNPFRKSFVTHFFG